MTEVEDTWIIVLALGGRWPLMEIIGRWCVRCNLTCSRNKPGMSTSVVRGFCRNNLRRMSLCHVEMCPASDATPETVSYLISFFRTDARISPCYSRDGQVVSCGDFGQDATIWGIG